MIEVDSMIKIDIERIKGDCPLAQEARIYHKYCLNNNIEPNWNGFKKTCNQDAWEKFIRQQQGVECKKKTLVYKHTVSYIKDNTNYTVSFNPATKSAILMAIKAILGRIRIYEQTGIALKAVRAASGRASLFSLSEQIPFYLTDIRINGKQCVQYNEIINKFMNLKKGNNYVFYKEIANSGFSMVFFQVGGDKYPISTKLITDNAISLTERLNTLLKQNKYYRKSNNIKKV